VSQGTLGSGPPQGLVRSFMRAPIWCYRLRLGWLLGGRFLLLTHIGRKSGLPRQTVLEVVRHDEATDSYIVASGWGVQSNWFQNIQKTPRVVITVGLHRFEATAIRLSPEEAEQELLDYARRYPHAFHILSSRMLKDSPTDVPETSRLLAQAVPMIVFHAARDSSTTG
jgi:deazaflavin-dependent oxidoreductase (nitroreductase family)